jgi:hypothetical protein
VVSRSHSPCRENGVDREAGGPKTRDIPLAAAHHLERDIMEDVEVARESGRVVGRMEQDTTGEMALLRTVDRENG